MEKAKHWFKDSLRTWADLEEKNPHHSEYRYYSMKWIQPQGKRCLDAGCGYRRYLRDYVMHHANAVIGLDINFNNLEKCKGINQVSLVRGDIEKLPFMDRSFDVVSCIATMEHLPHPLKALRERCRVTKKGGLLCLT